MNKKEIIKYWIESSDNDFATMQSMYKSKHYSWCLFIGHLVIEKLLKAYYIKNIGSKNILSHDLLRIAEQAGLVLDDKQKIFFATVTTFNINARYDDYKHNFYKLCTKDYTNLWNSKIKEYREWLKEKLLT